MRHVDLRKAGIAAGVFAGILATALVAGPSGALAQQQADTTGVFMKDVLSSLGIIEGDAPQIDYRERAPLVLPPGGGGTLPAPRSGAASAAAQPNWPKDPDVAARRRAFEAANAPAPIDRDKESARPLRPDEIRAGRRAGAGLVGEPSADTCHGDACSARPLDPRQLRGTAASRERAPVIQHGKEPERAALTQPPSGYRMPTNAAIPNPEPEPLERLDPASPYFFLNKQRAD